jgi:hypothetical protein
MATSMDILVEQADNHVEEENEDQISECNEVSY